MTCSRAGPRPWPVGERDWEARAREAMGPEGFDWVAGGAGEEWTLDANREAFRRWRLRPRVLTDTARMRPTDIECVVGDSRQAQALLGWRPSVPWDRTLDEVLADWRARTASSRP